MDLSLDAPLCEDHRGILQYEVAWRAHTGSRTFGGRKTFWSCSRIFSSLVCREDNRALGRASFFGDAFGGFTCSLSKMCAARNQPEKEAFVCWSFDELNIFYATHLHELRASTNRGSPQNVEISCPLLLGAVFFCCLLPNALLVECECCGKRLQTFPDIETSKFVDKNDGFMSHPRLSEQLPQVNRRFKDLGLVTIQMCGQRNACSNAACLCNQRAILCHSELIQTNITSKSKEWIDEHCVWK